MTMKGYSSDTENAATARTEGVNASWKDLAEVCARIRGMDADKAVAFLGKAAVKPTEGGIPILFKRHCKKLGHRRELGGRKGRYPWKSAAIVLKVLQSAMANGRSRGMGDSYRVESACANMKMAFPRLASKGRWARSNLETSRIEIILSGSEIPKAVSVKAPAKPEAKKPVAEAKESKPAAVQPVAPPVGTPSAVPPVSALKDEAKADHEHKHEAEKEFEQEKKREDAEPHHHGEYKKR
jgi:ribosomal protein L22